VTATTGHDTADADDDAAALAPVVVDAGVGADRDVVIERRESP
jgi:hypothetical protein